MSIALAGLAVVVATTGTAVAVTATTVNIVGANSTRAAQVDPGGRLRTAGQTAAINVVEGLVSISTKILTSPTSASLAVSRVAFYSPASNLQYERPPAFRVNLVKIAVGITGRCEDGTIERTYSYDTLAAGTNVVDTYPTPLIINSITHHLYCLGVYMVPDVVGANAGNPGTVQLTGYVASGTYGGAGTLAGTASGSAKLGVLRGG